MNLRKFYIDSKVDEACKILVNLPIDELAGGKIREQIIYFKNNHLNSYDWEEVGKRCATQFLKEACRKEVMLWIEGNEKIFEDIC